VDTIPFAISPAADLGSPGNSRASKSRGVLPSPSETHVDIGPFHLLLGGPVPTVVRGWVSRSGYSLAIQGDAQLQRLLRVARVMGIPAPQPVVEGLAKVDLQVARDWSGTAPRVTGKTQLRSIRAEVRGLNAPLNIASGNVTFAPDQIHVQDLVASVAGTAWRGSLELPRQCDAPGKCPLRFDLRADQITTDQLSHLLNPHDRKQPWYRFLSPSASSGSPYLLTLYAKGKLTANQVEVRDLVADRVSAAVELKDGKLRLSDLRGEVLGGRHTGEWEADFTAKPPEYSGSGTLEGVALSQLAAAMNDGWITGSATASYHVTASGLGAAEMFASATGTLQVEARDGQLTHIALAEGTGPLQMRRLAARLVLREGRFEIERGTLECPAGTYQVSGTASLNRILNLKLTREGAPGFNITGTLTDPRVSIVARPETQAALKP